MKKKRLHYEHIQVFFYNVILPFKFDQIVEKKSLFFIFQQYKTFLSQTTRIVSQAANSFTNRAGSDIISVVEDLLSMLKGIVFCINRLLNFLNVFIAKK